MDAELAQIVGSAVIHGHAVPVTITPEIAARMLAGISPERIAHRMHGRAIAGLVQSMLDDDWQLVPTDPVVFDTMGLLVNGKYRLLAVIFSGKPQRIYVQMV